MTTVLVVAWATSAVKTATIGCSLVQLVFLVDDCRVFCLVQLIPVVVLAEVLETCRTLRMQVVLLRLVMAAVGLDQLLQMLTLVVAIG